jgi:signal transduction histidine kinase
MAVPADVINLSSRQATWTLALGTLAALVLAFGFAWIASRRITSPIAALAAAARRLGRGGPAHVDGNIASFEELADVRLAVLEADAAIAERQTLREREQAALREGDRAKDEFIAVLGHELRNPLSAISTSSRLLREAPQGSRADAMAREIIERQTRQMTRLVEDLLDMSRLATGKLILQQEGFDLVDVTRTLVETWQQSQRLVEGRVRMSLAPAWVHADRARMEQVLANLLDNANKFTPPGRGIEVNVRSEGGKAILEVRDQGEGMPAALLASVFRPFEQGPQEHHRPSGGLGLGLSVVEKLVLLHGGTVTAESAGRGQGSTFRVALPLARTDSATRGESSALRPERR